jgi:hypothetical protein
MTQGGIVGKVKEAKAGETLEGDDAQAVRDRDAIQASVRAFVAQNQDKVKKGDSATLRDVIAWGYRNANEPITRTVDGTEITKPRAIWDAEPLGFTPTKELLDAAGVRSADEPGARAKLERVYAQKEREKQQAWVDAETQSRLRAQGRPSTDAEMAAWRNEVGQTYRTAKAPGASWPERRAWMYLGQTDEVRAQWDKAARASDPTTPLNEKLGLGFQGY